MQWEKIPEMLNRLLVGLVGSRNQRLVDGLRPRVAMVNELEAKLQGLSDERLRAKTDEFRERMRQGETRDELLPEAFAVVREASRRTVKMRHFDVQLLGGMILYQGKISEMSTGEGKTLVATLPLYLNALTGDPEEARGRGVHLVTVNDYLARRDRDWMGPVFEFLGLTVGVIQASMDNEERKKAYACDITYGTNNEFGFDYLRDNMKWRVEDQVQGKLCYAIVDEVDNILIDEARTPLIISGPAEDRVDTYDKADGVARQLKKGKDYEVKEKEHTVVLSDEGVARAEQLVGEGDIFSGENMEWPHRIEQALRAHELYKVDRDYIVEAKAGKKEIVIVDEFTGRLMYGRTWSEGLHQAIEAKEKVRIREENQTLATITFQNYFRLYEKLAGMTGTAMTEAAEFDKIYKLEAVSIPTNRACVREDHEDVIYRTAREKFDAIEEEIARTHEKGQPLLVGTISIEKSEYLSDRLKRRGIPHQVLNAKHHEKEATIIAGAGQKGTVTIATNMAGRGTDIVLGEGVKETGGLYVLGTERHEARRIDNQLRGRCGRQGDPGCSRFFLSLEDDLMRIFASDRVSSLLKRFGMEEGEDITHPMVSRSIARAQRKVESHHFEVRKNLLEYDEVMNEQRKIVYGERQRILLGEGVEETAWKMVENTTLGAVDNYLNPEQKVYEWDFEGLAQWGRRTLRVSVAAAELAGKEVEEVEKYLLERVRKAFDDKIRELGPDNAQEFLRFVLLQIIDTRWKEHLHGMDQLKSGIGLRGYGQMDPKLEYKREGYRMFEEMRGRLDEEVATHILRVKFKREDVGLLSRIWGESQAQDVHPEFEGYQATRRQMDRGIQASQEQGESKPKPIVIENRVSPNDPCPCGSGKKYKKCCKP